MLYALRRVRALRTPRSLHSPVVNQRLFQLGAVLLKNGSAQQAASRPRRSEQNVKGNVHVGSTASRNPRHGRHGDVARQNSSQQSKENSNQPKGQHKAQRHAPVRHEQHSRPNERPTSQHQRRSVPSAKNWSKPNTSNSSKAPNTNRDSQSKSKDLNVDKATKAERKPRTREVSLPALISVVNLSRVLNVNMRVLQYRMEKIGLTDVRPDHLLKYEDAELLAAEYNVVTVADEERAFDIYPRPALSDEQRAKAPLRPPVVAVMGHVDHGKTTLLDTLRSSSVAKGEAGGITQHIGAFSVPVKRVGEIGTVTFLDTPGHAAFSMMRSRGASVTDMVVLVVAADDGVMPQTKEVISLVKGDDRLRIPLVVAISKIDMPNADPQRVKYDLMAAGVEVEELGGDVPCVEISARKGLGLDNLEETLAVLAEMAELRAELEGPVEGRILESKVDKGRGNVATVLVQRGTLRSGEALICGTTWARVRQLMRPDGKAAKEVMPGFPVQVAGWRDLPAAGDEFLGAPDENACKRAVENRKRVLEQASLLHDAEQIDERRRLIAEAEALKERQSFEERKRLRELRKQEQEGKLDEEALAKETESRIESEQSNQPTEPNDTRKELLLILKGDFSGTVEALAGAIQDIGNAHAGVRIVSQSVGDPTDGDVQTAHAVGGQVLGFNVKASKNVQTTAARLQPHVKVHCDDVIYRLMEYVAKEVAALLPPRQELRVQGEAQVAQLFQIKGSGNKNAKHIAGCRVTNGVVNRAYEVRVLRGEDRKEVFRGRLDTLRQVKKDVQEMRKGTECGMSFDHFDDIRVDDVVQCFTTVEVPQNL
ncbi:translation initiation factor IF-2 [Malassezia yamatoensis]|uniref:Translation initiation factor IF-2, chloroplastic n=1 Tax=Malassezia yamatoensis TaxID=253288 RepID=A0AAJ5YSD8_9BASI|nr:translation initiation factor IF-2 [Malassezia yamatoensis]